MKEFLVLILLITSIFLISSCEQEGTISISDCREKIVVSESDISNMFKTYTCNYSKTKDGDIISGECYKAEINGESCTKVYVYEKESSKKCGKNEYLGYDGCFCNDGAVSENGNCIIFNCSGEGQYKKDNGYCGCTEGYIKNDNENCSKIDIDELFKDISLEENKMPENSQETQTMGNLFKDLTLEEDNKIINFVNSEYGDRDLEFKKELSIKLYEKTKLQKMGIIFKDITLEEENKIESYVNSKFGDEDLEVRNKIAKALYEKTKIVNN